MAASTISSLLGFNARTLADYTKEEDNTVIIFNVNSILVTYNLIGGSYMDGVALTIIYSFFHDVFHQARKL